MNETAKHQGGSRLVALLRHQRTLYRRLRLLADRQKALVSQNDSQPLLALLGERQKLVDGLVGLNEKLGPFRAQWTTVYGELDEPMRKEVSGLLEEVNSALSSILQSDRHDTATLAAKRQGMAERLEVVDAGSRASVAYASAGAGVRRGVTDSRA